MVKPEAKKRRKETRLSPEQIGELALGIFTGEILTSSQIPEHDHRLLPMIFMPLAFMSGEAAEDFKAHPPAFVYGRMRDAGPRSINGYPMFLKMGMVYKRDAALIRQKFEALQAAAKEILQP